MLHVDASAQRIARLRQCVPQQNLYLYTANSGGEAADAADAAAAAACVAARAAIAAHDAVRKPFDLLAAMRVVIQPIRSPVQQLNRVEVRPSPLHGLGMFARHPLSAGTTVYEECTEICEPVSRRVVVSPAWNIVVRILHERAGDPSASLHAHEPMAARELALAPGFDAHMLSTHIEKFPGYDVRSLFARVVTNYFWYKDPEVSAALLFQQASRFNAARTADAANAIWCTSYDSATRRGFIRVVATVDIPTGAEVCLFYGNYSTQGFA